VFKNVNTGELIAVGNHCASNFFGFKSRKAYLLRQAKRAAEAREQKAKVAAEVAAFLATADGLEAAFACDHYIVNDIKAKLFKWGSISEKQVALVLKIAKEEAEKTPEPPAEPIPAELLEGRHKLTGVILGFKSQENHFTGGYDLKMIFRDDRGFKLWGSAVDANKGDRVEFMARVEKSDRDECFGFTKRPTKVVVLEAKKDEE